MKRITSRPQEMMDEKDTMLSDSSISSSDSLSTRVRKTLAKRDAARNSRKRESMCAASTSSKSKVQKTSKKGAIENKIFIKAESSIPPNEPQEMTDEEHTTLSDSSISSSDSLKTRVRKTLAKRDAARNSRKRESVLLHHGAASTSAISDPLVNKKESGPKIVESSTPDLKSQEISKKECQKEFLKIMEEELTCIICTELFIKAVTLGCSHTFCDHCISIWNQERKNCPFCRKFIKTKTKTLAFDTFINKAVEQLDVESQTRRKEIAASRETKNNTQEKKKRRKTRVRIAPLGSRSSIQALQDNEFDDTNVPADETDSSDMDIFERYTCRTCGLLNSRRIVPFTHECFPIVPIV